jgi:hypothetical protein
MNKTEDKDDTQQWTESSDKQKNPSQHQSDQVALHVNEAADQQSKPADVSLNIPDTN